MAARLRVHGSVGAEPVQRPLLRLWDGVHRRGHAQPRYLRRVEVGTGTSFILFIVVVAVICSHIIFLLAIIFPRHMTFEVYRQIGSTVCINVSTYMHMYEEHTHTYTRHT